jgi:hypothetical protein
VRLAPGLACSRSQNAGEERKRVETAVWSELGGDGELAGRGLVQSRWRQAGTVAAGGHVVAGEAKTGCRAIGEGAFT